VELRHRAPRTCASTTAACPWPTSWARRTRASRPS
jgi:hypothetical protein